MKHQQDLGGRNTRVVLSLGLVLAACGLGPVGAGELPEAEAQSCNRQCPPAEKDGRRLLQSPQTAAAKATTHAKTTAAAPAVGDRQDPRRNGEGRGGVTDVVHRSPP